MNNGYKAIQKRSEESEGGAKAFVYSSGERLIEWVQAVSDWHVVASPVFILMDPVRGGAGVTDKNRLSTVISVDDPEKAE